MRGQQGFLPWSVLLASLGAVQAKLDLNSDSNIAIYWGQNSLQAAGGKGQGQQPLAEYCKNPDIDVIPMAFDMMINGPGGAPEVDFSVDSADCDVFPGTQLKNCPKIAQDIQACQDAGKTILLSIGGATYSEGGFKSEADAKDGAKLIWETFGPQQPGSKALRPFGNASLDGFDFDFEANVQHMAPFANELRALMDKDTSRQRFLTAAPQCPYPDAADKDILNGPVPIDAVWVQFYNNFCGVNNFDKDATKSKYNFEEWDNWAKTVSKNPNVKVILGVPADTTAASTGYIDANKLADVIEYSKKFESFGGVMMWDTSQAYANNGFISRVRKALGGPNSGSSSSSKSASATASASTSTNPPKTSLSSNAPGSSSSSSSSSGSGSSPNGHSQTTTTTTTTAPEAPTKSAKPAKPTEPTKSTTTQPATTPAPTKPAEKPTSVPTTVSTTTTTKAKPAPEPTAEPSSQPAADDDDDDDDEDINDDFDNDDFPFNNVNNSDSDNSDAPNNQTPPSQPATGVDNTDQDKPKGVIHQVLGPDLFGLLDGLRSANNAVGEPVKNVAHGLTKNLRHAKRIGYN